ncbi:GDSL-type esterase/lipase family protein [Arthrobacter sp. zg-Y859]|uniref:GDSL-type esterase/lipase family protein n=1 Tax=Arthrobacter jinronghuae TaxID=2964609 RepID=A0ABT1NT11_9MICC|nr:SGNH/GDSL hydrolase family protein [Arthrobacter jinronghuae]MCQ1950790.1 GDSL-type esterase/lipase family protein [Arthrobacter jinronghuae]UWX79259.1 GDSL-type esterase/lipase family protein [Arthrobacter jinronghuae]
MITTGITASLVRGAAELETTPRGLRPHRLPAAVRTRFPDPQLMMAESQPSGVRLALTTTSEVLAVVVHPSRVVYRGADRPRGSMDLVVDGKLLESDDLTGGDYVEVDMSTGAATPFEGPSHTSVFRLPAGDKVIEIWLPHNEAIELVELRSDAPVAPYSSGKPVWLHHGSSISHGSNAATPSQIWPVIAAHLGGVELHNLGLGGSALVDPFTAQVMRDTPADVISVKLGINVVNMDSMRLRAFVPAVHGFLDTIREGHPETPLVLISPIFCGIHEDTPGPGAFDPASFGTEQIRFVATGSPEGVAAGQLTLRVIREALESLAARRTDDPNLHFLDGLSLYGAEDAEAYPLPDALHPDTATHRLIGERFAEYAFNTEGPFAKVPGVSGAAK